MMVYRSRGFDEDFLMTGDRMGPDGVATRHGHRHGHIPIIQKLMCV